MTGTREEGSSVTREVLPSLQPETFLSPDLGVGGWASSWALSMGAQGNFLFLCLKVVSSQFHLTVGHPR